MTAASLVQSEPCFSSLRVDKWLWHCRIFKSRSAAARFVSTGRMRVNSRPIAKPAHILKPGDILTFVWRDRVHVLQVQALGVRRGPPSAAHSLYTDLSDPVLAPAPCPMLDREYGQSYSGATHAATG
ncbi:MAG: RNA-binding S4 domain-containing protein [Pseudomonadota bacterium]